MQLNKKILLVSIIIIFLSTGFTTQTEMDVFDCECEAGCGDIPLDEETYQEYLKPVKLDRSDGLPFSYDARSEGIVTPAKNQGNCGSCWAFASIGAMESHLLAAGLPANVDLSEQQQVSCNSEQSGCCGGNILAIRFWENYGPIYESCFSYGESSTYCSTAESTVPCSDSSSCTQLDYRVRGFYTVAQTQFRESLLEDGPSYFRFTVYTDFHTFWNTANSGEVYVNEGSTPSGGHAVLIIGWDDSKQAYLLKNSWGENGGPEGDGTFWMAYDGHANNLFFQMVNFNIIVPNPYDDAYEENDSISEAYELAERNWLHEIDGYGIQSDDDWYKIYVRDNFKFISIIAEFSHSEGDIDIELYNSNGSVLEGSYSVSDNETINYEVPIGNTYYYIKVYFGDAGNQYNLFWAGNIVDDNYEENDSMAEAYDLVENSWLYYIDGLGIQADDDWYKINVPNDNERRVVVIAGFIHSEGDIDIQLFNSDGYYLSGSYSITDEERIDYVVHELGTYYIRVFYENMGNNYNLVWQGLTTPYTDDYYEDNDTMGLGTAYELEEGLWLSDNHGYGIQKDDDWYKINLHEGLGKILIIADFLHEEGDIDIELFNSSGNLLAGSYSVSDGEMIDYSIPTDGIYYIRVFYGNAGNQYNLLWLNYNNRGFIPFFIK